MWYVYVLLCADASLYTGSTDDVERRFIAHQNGKGAKYTRSHPPLKIIYSECCDSKSAALKREAEIKSWSRAEKIQRLGLSL